MFLQRERGNRVLTNWERVEGTRNSFAARPAVLRIASRVRLPEIAFSFNRNPQGTAKLPHPSPTTLEPDGQASAQTIASSSRFEGRDPRQSGSTVYKCVQREPCLPPEIPDYK